ncbi:MAG: protein kinase, partial [Victivallales bacterium]|nr:protein kinase [Victivallales bacterium]
MLQPGDTFAGCKIITQCGHGAYGHVYLATDALGHRVAVKQLLTPDAGEYELKGLRNYISLATPHPALLRVFLCGMENGLPFYVMEAADDGGDGTEYVPDTLALRLKRQGRIPAQEALAICHSLLDGLETMHRGKLLHRDVKPENVIFVGGRPKLADPGLTRNLAQTLSVAGTPGYIAPELFSGEGTVSPCTDIYALGKLLYHIVTGLPPEKYPLLPEGIPVSELYQVCRPLLRICSSNPAKRCRNCAECRAILPQRVQEHGPIRRFRDALYVHPSFRHRLLAYAVMILVLAVLCGVGVVGVKTHQGIKRKRLEKQVAVVREEFRELEWKVPALLLQLDELNELTDATAAWNPMVLRKISESLQNSQPEEAALALKATLDGLGRIAQRHIPQPSASTEPTAENFLASARGWGYLSSPLGKHFLTPEQQRNLRTRLEKEADALSGGDTLRLGKDYHESEHHRFTMAFLPPGRFTSITTLRLQKVDYPFWIQNMEISGEQFQHTTHLSVRHNTPQQAAEYLCWNDALQYCRRLTDVLSKYHVLPPDYGVRPPTEEEWEYAALGGWGKRLPQRDIPENARTQLPGQGEPNGWGLYNLDDNLSEIVSPYPQKPSAFRDAVVLRGENYKSKHTGLAYRGLYILDQCHMVGGGRLRPVLGPIAEDFYKNSWFRGPTMQPCRIGEAVYAGWSVCFAYLPWNEAAELARCVGAMLPEENSLPELKERFRKVSILASFPCHLGIQWLDGKWTRISDGKEVVFTGKSTPRNVNGKMDCLGASGFRFYPQTRSTVLPSMLFRWEDQEAFQKRLETWLEKGALHQFEVDGRSFVVCRGKMAGYVVRGFVNFMGGRQPVLPSGEFTRRVIDHLPPDKRVALGPIRFYGKWEQSDGSVTNFSDLDIARGAPNSIASPTLNVLVAYHGNLLDGCEVQAILLER